MLKFLPEKYDKRWFTFALILTAILWLAMVLSEKFILQNITTGKFIMESFKLSLVIGLLMAAFGFLNARVLFAALGIGVFTGLIIMLAIYIKNGTSEDFTGLSMFILSSIFGFLVGILGEIGVLIFRGLSKKN